MLDSLFSIIAPHYCLSCGKIGQGMCLRCKNNLSLSPIIYCVACGAQLQKYRCAAQCKLSQIPQYIATLREGVVQRLLHDTKFAYARGHIQILVDILERSPVHLPADAVIVPIPSSARHVRQRGFDHTKLLAKQLAQRGGCRAEFLLGRQHNHRQVGSSRSQRIAQADTAFYCAKSKGCTKPVVIVDDIITTGATMSAAVRCLQGAGYVNISILAVAYQPLEE